MSRKVFWIGVVVLTIMCVGALFLVYRGGVMGRKNEVDIIGEKEKFLYDLYTGHVVKSKVISFEETKNETNLFFVLQMFLNEKPEEFVSKEWLKWWCTNEDVRLMLAIAEKRMEKDSPFRHFEINNLVFKVNYYEYMRLFGIFLFKERDFLNLKNLLIYAHNSDFLDIAVDVATNLLTLPFSDPEVMSYYGSTLTKYALLKSSPVEKVDYVSKGTYYIDKAVNQYPDFLVPRLVRIFNYLSLPSFFRKEKFIEEDLSIILSNCQNIQKMKVVKKYNEIEAIEIPFVQLVEIGKKLEESNVFSAEKKRKYIEMIEKILEKEKGI